MPAGRIHKVFGGYWDQGLVVTAGLELLIHPGGEDLRSRNRNDLTQRRIIHREQNTHPHTQNNVVYIDSTVLTYQNSHNALRL